MSNIEEATQDLEALLNNCKVTDIKIESVRNVEYQEEEYTMAEQQTFKHLIEHDGHIYLMETAFEFQPTSFLKDGYVPFLKVFKIREVNLEEESEDEDD